MDVTHNPINPISRMHINANKSGLAVGAFLGAFHFIWSLMVASGTGQWFLDFIFRLHMIQPPYTVGPFDITMAASLVVVTALMGYVFGYAYAFIWNRVHRQ